MIVGLPWWVFMMILLIFLCGYMAFRAMRAENELDQHFIEHEGKIYIDRMEAERLHKQGEKKRMSN